MDIKDAEILKSQLVAKIEAAIVDFEKATGLQVEEIGILPSKPEEGHRPLAWTKILL